MLSAIECEAACYFSHQPAMISWYAFFYVAKVAAEAVFVQFLSRGPCPRSAGIRRNLVREDQLAFRAAEL
jgi:hypothetical protein